MDEFLSRLKYEPGRSSLAARSVHSRLECVSYEGHPEDRARETFNLLPGRGIDDPVNLTDVNEEDLPKEKLQQALLLHDGAVYLIKNG
jgi:hypothetical protein